MALPIRGKHGAASLRGCRPAKMNQEKLRFAFKHASQIPILPFLRGAPKTAPAMEDGPQALSSRGRSFPKATGGGARPSARSGPRKRTSSQEQAGARIRLYTRSKDNTNAKSLQNASKTGKISSAEISSCATDQPTLHAYLPGFIVACTRPTGTAYNRQTLSKTLPRSSKLRR